MRCLTQTDLAPGNCVQTVVACLLDVDPSEVLDQTAFVVTVPRADGRGMRRGTPGYWEALNEWLGATRGVRIVDMVPARGDRATRGLHMMTGRTVRTPRNGGLLHAVVGRDLVPIWDPHPSRDSIILDRHTRCHFLMSL